MKVAIASSGLGHVSRGIESWAMDTAVFLSNKGVDVTLFTGASVSSLDIAPKIVTVPCLRRNNLLVRLLIMLSPGFTWRWGLKSGYGWEQFSFWSGLRRLLKKGEYDILHVQDPMLAYWCRMSRKSGVLNTREILAHGTEESIEFLKSFEFVQHLTPWHLRESLLQLDKYTDNKKGGRSSVIKKNWTAIPNFVDCNTFYPVKSPDDKKKYREEFGIPENAFVIGIAAAVKKDHKRIDYLIKEFAAFLNNCNTRNLQYPFLVIAGARQKDSEELAVMAYDLAGDRIKVLFDIHRSKMPHFYKTLDVFVLTSLFEMMPIAVLEALSSGLPVIANKHPVLEWMICNFNEDKKLPEGGICINMTKQGELAGCFSKITKQWIDNCGKNARKRAELMFSGDSVVDLYLEYYHKVSDTVICK